MSDDNIQVTKMLDTASLDSIYATRVPDAYLQKRLAVDVFYDVVDATVKAVAADILKQHGEDLVNKAIKQDTVICEKISQVIARNVDVIINELFVLKSDFDAGRLCTCGQNSQHTKDFSNRDTVHQWEPISKLGYLELRYAKIEEWVKSLNYVR